MALLKEQGEVATIEDPLDTRHEISVLLAELDKMGFPAAVFENVNNYDSAVVGNLLGTRKRLSMALGVEQSELYEQLIPRIENRIPPVLVNNESSGIRIVDRDRIDLIKLLPALTHYAQDSGPYITSGITSSKNPETGATGRGLHRMEVRGKNTLGISLLNPPLADIYRMHKELGKRMETATVIGIDPSVLVSVVLKSPPGVDKLSIAGGIRGEAVKMEKAATVDVEVPAGAELLIEGYIDPEGEEQDGNMGESSGYYISFEKSPMIQVTSVRYRENGVYHAIVPWSLEVDNLLSLVHGLDFIPKLKKEIPGIRKVRFVPRTFGSHVVMSTSSDDKGENRRALAMALSLTNSKKVILVDDDVDIEDAEEVEWALATRFQADRDLIMVPQLRGQPIDPSSGEGFATTKIGMDATKPQRVGFEKVGFPAEISTKIIPIIKGMKKKD